MFKKVSFFNTKSKKIQIGIKNMMKAKIYPNGLMKKASFKLPCVIAMTDRVDPQEGQGMLVTFFIKHTSISLFTLDRLLKLQNIQTYPAKQAETIKI
jgi:hypothetical protein